MAQLTVQEAAEALGVSVDTIRRWRKSGRLAGQQVSLGNAGGIQGFQWMLDVPDDMIAAAQGGGPDLEPSPKRGGGRPATGSSSSLAVVVAERDQLAARLALVAQHVDDIRAERDRALSDNDRLLGIIEAMAGSRGGANASLSGEWDAQPGSRVGKAWAALRGR